MKILHVSKYYYPFRGGTEHVAQECVNALKGFCKQKVICFNDVREDKTDLVDDIEVIRAGTIVKVASQGLSGSIGRKLREVIHSFAPDVILFHYPNPFVAHYLLRYLPDGCKLVIYWHLDIVKQRLLRKLFIRQNQRLIARADQIITGSPPYLEGSPWLRSVREKVRVIPYCINAKQLQKTIESDARAEMIRQENGDKIICLAVGRHTAYKGTRYLIEAAGMLDDRFVVYLIGEGEETAELKALAAGDPKIHFLGIVDDIELKAYYTAADILCFPSVTKNEAFGIALAEGMYYGKPAVTFTIPGSGVNYVSVNGETGIEVPNRDVAAFAAAIWELALEPEKRKKMGIAARKRVEELFMGERFRENIQELFISVHGSATQ